jgi:hypothetical protein
VDAQSVRDVGGGSDVQIQLDTGTTPASDAGSANSGDLESGVEGGADARVTSDSGPTAHWMPAKNTTFYWDLQNAPPDNSRNVGAYDIDGWNNSASEVTALHALGIKVICYMDVGTYEPGRPDSNSFPSALKGAAVSGWPGELWLDVRASGPSYAELQAIMLARFKACQAKGFDAVEPDNLDSYENNPGFSTTAEDQLTYDEWVAETVHSLGMAVFQKNDLGQISTLVTYFDGILDEECSEYSECSALAPYVAANKPAWDAEYTDDGETTAKFCAVDAKAGITGVLFSLALDGTEFEPCADDVGKQN